MSVETMGQRIRRLRKARGWTQAAFAAEVGVYRWTVQRWETAVWMPSVVSLARLADALDTSADYLIGREAGNDA